MPSDLTQGLGLQDLGKGKTLKSTIKNSDNNPIDSKHQEPSDGITTKIGGGKKLGGELKNSGGTWESIGDSKHQDAADGITKKDGNKAGELGQNSAIKNSGSQQEKAKESVAPMHESEWDPDRIADLLSEDVPDIQYLFDDYARQVDIATLEEFNSVLQSLCGDYEVNEEGFVQLMDTNADKAFFESEDGNGKFWVVRPISEGMGGMQMTTPPLNPFKAADTALTGGVQRPGRTGGMNSQIPRRGESLAGDVEQYGDGFDLDGGLGPEEEGGIGGDLGNMGSDLGMDDGLDVGEQVASGLGTAAGATGGPVGAGVGGAAGRVAGRGVGNMVGRGMRRRPGRIGEDYEMVAVETHECGMTGGNSGDEVGRDLPSDATSSGLDSVGKTTKMPDAIESKHEEPDDGITDEMGGLGKELGQNSKIKNKLSGGAESMKENIQAMTAKAKQSISEAAKKFGSPGKYSLQFRVESTQIGQARTSGKLVESLLDMEELTTAFGVDAAKMYVLFVDNNNRVAHKAVVDVGKIRSRGPVVSENKVVFRSPKVAKVFAEQVAKTGSKCLVSSHNWGSKVTGKFNWNVASSAYRNIPSVLSGK